MNAWPVARRIFRRQGTAPLASVWLALGVLVGLTALPARAADGDVDPGFNPNANDYVTGLAVQADGKILLGGAFTTAGGGVRNHIARLHSDGSLDAGFNPDANGPVMNLAVQYDAEILLGGFFTTVNGLTRNRIARLNADGSLDTGFNPDSSSIVSSLAIQADGKILLGGAFGTVGGAARHCVARLNGDGTIDSSFNPDTNNEVQSVVVQADGKILLGGMFTTVGGMPRNQIARLLNGPAIQNLSVPDATQVVWIRGGTAPEVEQVIFELSTDGEVTWMPLGSGTRVSGGWAVSGLSLPQNGAIRARGRAAAGYNNGSSSLIEQISSFALPQDIGVRADGTNLEDGTGTVSFGTALFDMSGTVVTFTVTNDGGADLTLGDVTLTGSAAGDYQLNTSAMAASLAPGASTTFTVAFSPTADGLRSAALQIASNDADESPFDIALSGTRTRVDDRFNPNVAGPVFCTIVQADGRILLGGAFTNVGGNPRNRIARLFPDGMPDFGFDPALNVGGTVFNLAEQSDGRILLGGSFSTVNGVPRNRIARLSRNGTLEQEFNPNANLNVFCTAIQADGRILLGGAFTSIGGTARAYLARLNPDGMLDPDFNPNPNGIVYSVAVQADGGILLGGAFSTIGGTARNCLARLNPDGTLDTGFDPNANSVVNCLAVQADGKILLGGAFTAVGGLTRNHLARLNSDGTPDPGFDPNVNNNVTCAVTQADGKILLGGNFTSVGGTARAWCARIHGDGTLDTSFRQDANNPVYSVALQADGQILLGGNFTSVGGVTRNRLARLLNEPATETLRVAFPPTALQWLRGGSAPEIAQVTFELSTDGGATWTALGGGTRIAGGWAATNLMMPPSGMIRARGRAAAGQYNGSSSLIEYLSLYAEPAPEITVRLDGNYLADGYDTVSFGTVLLGQGSPPATFTITNSGDADLTLGNITLIGGGAGDYVTDASAVAGLLAPGTSTTFSVTFRPTADGPRNASLQIANNDEDEAPLDVALSGTQTRVDGGGFNPEVGGSFVGGGPVIDCAAVQADGKILLGGGFGSVGGTACGPVARLHSDGTLDSGFAPNVTGETVETIAVLADGRILLGGGFTTVGGIARDNIAMVDEEGTVIPGFNPGPSGWVYAVAVQADGAIVVGGNFNSIGGAERSGVALLNADGTLDPAFNPVIERLSPYALVSGLAIQRDGKLLVTGNFSTVEGIGSQCIARLLSAPAVEEIEVPDASRIRWLRGGTTAEVDQVVFELSIDEGVTWTPVGNGGVREDGGWGASGLSLPPAGLIRARGRTTGGLHNGSSGVIEQIAGFDLSELRVTRFVRNGDGSFTIEWLGGGILQISETLADWQDVPGAVSPYTFSSAAPQLFARIRR